MYASTARFRRVVQAGSTIPFVLALAVALAMTLGASSNVSAHETLLSFVRRSHGHHHGKTTTNNGQSKTPAIVTESGPLKGIVVGNVAEFLGIPYAAPPVGNLRWMPPQPYGPFKGGLFDASKPGSVCTQGGRGTEDCLFLNIYVPNFKKNGTKHMPVMFWIHGGGLTGGAGSDYDPAPLLAPGNVIVVTINYRLGYLGFFAQTALDSEGHDAGNYGLMDQQFAMQWVQNNIAAFGGDPGNVTIFGESAGGHSVYANIASPTAAGLFSHAIAESGSYLIFDTFIQPIVTLSVGETTGNGLVPGGDSVASGLGCTTAACLRAVPATTLVSIQPGTLYAFIDGTLLTQTPASAFASGEFNRVPVIAGTNHDEWRIFVADQYDLRGNPILTMAEYDTAVIALWGPLLGPIVEIVYPYAAFPSGGVALGTSGTDGIFACSARNGDELLSNFTTTYAYEFNDENAPPPQSQVPGLTFPLGAFHGAELQYLFDVGFSFELDAAQLQLSNAMVSYWTNFAASGDPNSPATPTWSPYNSTADQFQSLIPPTPTVEPTGEFSTDHLCDDFWNLIP
jgi:para-nitrobenzyl esterase